MVSVRGQPAESEALQDLKAELERTEKALEATEVERDTLMSELEELDRQHQEATQVRPTTCSRLDFFFLYCYL